MRIFIVVSMLLFVTIKLIGQDTLHFDDIKSYHYVFELVDGELSGPGADFIKKEFHKHQVVMLGEYHGMKAISEFTAAIIPLLDAVGFKHFGLEVGPTVGKILDTIPASKTIEELKRLNRKYAKPYEDDMDTPIPFFESIEDAQFLQAANQRDWNIFGVDQEYINSYALLLDVLFQQLSNPQQDLYHNLYEQAQDSLAIYYDRELQEDLNYTVQISKSKTVNALLDILSMSDSNRWIVDAFRKSVEIYNYYPQRKWSLNYSTRMTYMKQMLKRGLDRASFDFTKDKLLMKMGRIHLSRGVSSYGYNEIGNTLHELAEYNDKSALGIGFEIRYEMDNDTLVDALDAEGEWVQNDYGFKQFGQKDKWVAIDLRQMRQDFYWYPSPLKRKLNASLEKLMENYEVLIIPPAYAEPTPNY